MDCIHNTGTATAYMDKIADAIKRAAPETAKEIMASLHALKTSEEAKDKNV
jgi:hypothetical protein